MSEIKILIDNTALGLIISDLNMPRMSGFEVDYEIESYQERKPHERRSPPRCHQVLH
jgi:CheY-like chemotaxis protein